VQLNNTGIKQDCLQFCFKIIWWRVASKWVHVVTASLVIKTITLYPLLIIRVHSLSHNRPGMAYFTSTFIWPSISESWSSVHCLASPKWITWALHLVSKFFDHIIQILELTNHILATYIYIAQKRDTRKFYKWL